MWEKAKILGPYSPTILKRFFVFLSKVCKLEYNNFWLAKPYGSASQKLCFIQTLLNIEKSIAQDKNVLKNGWWIRTQVTNIFSFSHNGFYSRN